jgi:hypothetical protein
MLKLYILLIKGNLFKENTDYLNHTENFHLQKKYDHYLLSIN